MKRTMYFACLLILSGLGMLLMAGNSRKLAPGQAGIAYEETESGHLRPKTEQRDQQRTIVPERQSETSEEWLTQFKLIERSGKTIGSAELQGQPYVAGFFFTTCPSICLQQNKKVELLQEKYRGKSIRFVSISVDPEIDRPEVLQQYANQFKADKEQWLFFTGDMDYISRVGGEYFSLGVLRRGHPEKFALVNAEGKIHGLYTWSDPNQWLALQTDIDKMIANSGK